MKTYLVTGGAGFIGTNFVKYMLQKDKDICIIVLDTLSYAGSKERLQKEIDTKKIEFIQGDICKQELIEEIFIKFDVDYVVNFAAETHVDRSIENPRIFLETNILGTQTLLEVSKKFWTIGEDEKGYPIYRENKRYLQISTDEVYGSLEKNSTMSFREDTPLAPSSPYAASKASADMMVLAYHRTYHLPVNITRCSNNYGPYQFPEKLIPLMIGKILCGKALPIYGDGTNVRDWLYVEDHCRAISLVLENGNPGRIYNIGGFHEETNIDLVILMMDTIIDILTKEPEYQKGLRTDIGSINRELIHYTQDRLGHDTRYSVDSSRIIKELGWQPNVIFSTGMRRTIQWYLAHTEVYRSF